MPTNEQHQENIRIIEKACIEANPNGFEFGIKRPVRLSDVLLAIEAVGNDISVYQDGMFIDHSKNSTAKYTDYRWNLLKDSLDSQSPETVEFIASLLK